MLALQPALRLIPHPLGEREKGQIISLAGRIVRPLDTKPGYNDALRGVLRGPPAAECWHSGRPCDRLRIEPRAPDAPYSPVTSLSTTPTDR